MRKPFSTKHFTWLHVPKTGGTWLFQILRTLAPPSWELAPSQPAHVRLYEVPVALEQWVCHPERVGLPIVASTRNPWDWYVSLYFFFEQHYRNGTGGFAVPRAQWPQGLKNWAKLYAAGDSAAGFRKALPSILHDMHVKAVFGGIRPQYEYLRNPDGTLGVIPVRFEGLRKNIVDALDSLGAEVPPGMRQKLASAARTNTSGHAHYSACYTPELRDLVAKHEGWLIETMGYEFEER